MTPVWQCRFYDFNVWSERKRIEKLRYMHRNPVARGLGGLPGTVGLEQLSGVRVWEIGTVKLNDWPGAKITMCKACA